MMLSLSSALRPLRARARISGKLNPIVRLWFDRVLPSPPLPSLALFSRANWKSYLSRGNLFRDTTPMRQPRCNKATISQRARDIDTSQRNLQLKLRESRPCILKQSRIRTSSKLSSYRVVADAVDITDDTSSDNRNNPLREGQVQTEVLECHLEQGSLLYSTGNLQSGFCVEILRSKFEWNILIPSLVFVQALLQPRRRNWRNRQQQVEQ